MADPASLVANPNFAPRVTDPNLRALLTDANFAWRMKEYLRERQHEIEAQQEPPPVYVLEPSWPDIVVWERKGMPPFVQEDPVPERAIDARSLDLYDVVPGNDEAVASYMLNASYKNVSVCVIMPKFDFIDFHTIRKFCDHLGRSKYFDHPNVVKVLGLTTDAEETLMVVTECLSKGSLYSLIHDGGDKSRGLDLLQVSMQICDGMKYLHDRGFQHGNLCTKNIFVNTDNVVKLFGIDPFGERVYEGFQTARTDVFSFGVVLWELVTRGIPLDVAAQRSYTIPKKSERLKKKENSWEETCLRVCSLLRSRMDTEHPLVQVIDKCWEFQETPTTFAAISTLLKSLLTPQEKENESAELVASDDVSRDNPKKRGRKKKNTQIFGVFPCKSCKRTFKSEVAVQAHTMAKHSE